MIEFKDHVAPVAAALLTRMVSRNTLPRVLLFHGVAGCGKRTAAETLATAIDAELYAVTDEVYPRTSHGVKKLLLVESAELADHDALVKAVQNPLHTMVLTTTVMSRVPMDILAHCLPIAFKAETKDLLRVLQSVEDIELLHSPAVCYLANNAHGSVGMMLNSAKVCLEAKAYTLEAVTELLDPHQNTVRRILGCVYSGDSLNAAVAADALLAAAEPQEALTAISDTVSNLFLAADGDQRDAVFDSFMPLWNLWAVGSVTRASVRMGLILCAVKQRREAEGLQELSPESIADAFVN